MGSAYSIHISVGEVAAGSYRGPIRKLQSPPTNAAEMERLAGKFGVSIENRHRLCGELATKASVGNALDELAQKCKMY